MNHSVRSSECSRIVANGAYPRSARASGEHARFCS